MLNRTRSEIATIAGVVSLVSGCTTLMSHPTPPVVTQPSAVWIQNPRAYWEDVASSSEHERERVREQALEEFLRTPGTQQQIHLSLVYDATVSTVADGSAAADSLTHALGNLSDLPAESRAVLTDLLMRTEQRVDDMRSIASRDSELTTLRATNQSLQRSKAAAEAQHAAAQKALKDAQAKLEALKSIEQTLESNTPQQPAGEVEPNPNPDEKQ